MQSDRERLQILAAWHAERALEATTKMKRAMPTNAANYRQLAEHHLWACEILRKAGELVQTIGDTLRDAKPAVDLVREAVDAWPQFDADDSVSGADMVEWFENWRKRAKMTLDPVEETAEIQ